MQIHLPPRLIRGVVGLASSAANFLGPKLVDSKKVEVTLNLSYAEKRALHPRLLDVYRPKDQIGKTLPISILIHGGGFRFFSKDSHALCASQIAQSGKVVFCLDYGLTPEHPYPTGLTDVIHAYEWIIANAAQFGGDVNQISLIGESAGSNLALALTLHLFKIRQLEGQSDVSSLARPKTLVLHCGHLQVTDVERYQADPRCFPIAYSRVSQIQADYLKASVGTTKKDWGLANPLVEVEKLTQLPEGFPKVFVPVGEKDPIINDSERMAKALERLGQSFRLKIYKGQGHAFHVFPLKKAARDCWQDIIQFIDENSKA